MVICRFEEQMGSCLEDRCTRGLSRGATEHQISLRNMLDGLLKPDEAIHRPSLDTIHRVGLDAIHRAQASIDGMELILSQWA